MIYIAGAWMNLDWNLLPRRADNSSSSVDANVTFGSRNTQSISTKGVGWFRGCISTTHPAMSSLILDSIEWCFVNQALLQWGRYEQTNGYELHIAFHRVLFTKNIGFTVAGRISIDPGAARAELLWFTLVARLLNYHWGVVSLQDQENENWNIFVLRFAYWFSIETWFFKSSAYFFLVAI